MSVKPVNQKIYFPSGEGRSSRSALDRISALFCAITSKISSSSKASLDFVSDLSSVARQFACQGQSSTLNLGGAAPNGGTASLTVNASSGITTGVNNAIGGALGLLSAPQALRGAWKVHDLSGVAQAGIELAARVSQTTAGVSFLCSRVSSLAAYFATLLGGSLPTAQTLAAASGNLGTCGFAAMFFLIPGLFAICYKEVGRLDSALKEELKSGDLKQTIEFLEKQTGSEWRNIQNLVGNELNEQEGILNRDGLLTERGKHFKEAYLADRAGFFRSRESIEKALKAKGARGLEQRYKEVYENYSKEKLDAFAASLTDDQKWAYALESVRAAFVTKKERVFARVAGNSALSVLKVAKLSERLSHCEATDGIEGQINQATQKEARSLIGRVQKEITLNKVYYAGLGATCLAVSALMVAGLFFPPVTAVGVAIALVAGVGYTSMMMFDGLCWWRAMQEGKQAGWDRYLLLALSALAVGSMIVGGTAAVFLTGGVAAWLALGVALAVGAGWLTVNGYTLYRMHRNGHDWRPEFSRQLGSDAGGTSHEIARKFFDKQRVKLAQTIEKVATDTEEVPEEFTKSKALGWCCLYAVEGAITLQDRMQQGVRTLVKRAVDWTLQIKELRDKTRGFDKLDDALQKKVKQAIQDQFGKQEDEAAKFFSDGNYDAVKMKRVLKSVIGL
jgi:hypothetical protein